MNQDKQVDWELIHAFERGIDDGFFSGNSNDTYVGPRDELRAAYKRGYDHGVWMYCETVEGETNERIF